jgi:hypothetical protein
LIGALGTRRVEEAMLVTIRRYNPKNGALNKASVELLRRQIQDEFLPVIQRIPGFRAYYVASVANRELVTLTLCDSPEAAAASARCAAEYTLRNPLVYELGQPELIEAEILTSVESTPLSPDPGAAAGTALALWYEESRAMLLTASER